MAYLPELTQTQQSILTTSAFMGYDHRPVIQDGALYDMKNLSGDAAPLLTTREKRGMLRALSGKSKISTGHDSIFVLEQDRIKVIGHDGATKEYCIGMFTSDMDDRCMVFMGAFLCVFPDKVYLNTKNLEYGKMDASFAPGAAKTYTLNICRENGDEYSADELTVSVVKPEQPTNGMLWLDSSLTNPTGLHQYNAQTEEWVSVQTTYVKIEYSGIGIPFEAGDVITIKGFPMGDKSGVTDKLNGDKLIHAKDDNFIVIPGIVYIPDQKITANVTFERAVPDMDYVVESDNRLWGCRYGQGPDGTFINEIYCCKLGDFKNWRSYIGLSTDSFAATVGTEGPFTGAAVLRGMPVFFKENYVHKVSGKIPSAFSITTTKCAGVQADCWDSIKMINETLYYKSNMAVMAYDGSMPVPISDVFGGDKYYRAKAGIMGKRYCLFMEKSDEDYALFILYTDTGLWYKQTTFGKIYSFAEINNAIYGENLLYVNSETNKIYAMRHVDGLTTQEEAVSWEGVFGTFGYEYPERKYLSRFNIRMKMDAGASVDLYIQYDSDGVWHKQGSMHGTTTRTYMLPVIPRRCDHCQVKLKGKGAVTLYSISRILEVGGDG